MNRSLGHRTATLRNLARALFLTRDAEGNHTERIETTVTKARVLRPFVERLITYGKKGTLHHRRLAFAMAQDKQLVHRIFSEVAGRYEERPGGYTRIVRTRRRQGDGAEMAFIELVDRPAEDLLLSQEAEATE